jgi:septum formation protein
VSDPAGERAAAGAEATPVLHLASASERRRDILAALGLRFTWAGVDIDECPLEGESPDMLARRLAVGKMRAARDRGVQAPVILGADTVVTLENRLFGKPASREEACDMLSQLSGRVHTVITAVAAAVDGRELTALSATEVRFREIDAREARLYWDTGEAAGKAGGYAVQGLGGLFVESLSGSYSGVVGLPVFETAALLQQAGIDVLGEVQKGLMP